MAQVKLPDIKANRFGSSSTVFKLSLPPVQKPTYLPQVQLLREA